MNSKVLQQRNKAQSKQKLIDAVGKIIVRNGYNGIGINAIAKEANLDKVLIYRYFNGLNGLLKEFAGQKDFFIKISNSIQDEIEKTPALEYKNLLINVLIEQLRDLRKNRELQEIIKWELVEKNDLTLTITKERELKGYALSKTLKDKMNLPNNDSDAVVAFLVSGIYYLVLRSVTLDVFNGIPINTEKGWYQIEKAIHSIVNSYFDSINK